MIAADSHSVRPPSTSVGTLPLGFRARYAGDLCSPRPRSTCTYSIGDCRYFATAHTLRGLTVSNQYSFIVGLLRLSLDVRLDDGWRATVSTRACAGRVRVAMAQAPGMARPQVCAGWPRPA